MPVSSSNLPWSPPGAWSFSLRSYPSNFNALPLRRGRRLSSHLPPSTEAAVVRLIVAPYFARGRPTPVIHFGDHRELHRNIDVAVQVQRNRMCGPTSRLRPVWRCRIASPMPWKPVGRSHRSATVVVWQGNPARCHSADAAAGSLRSPTRSGKLIRPRGARSSGRGRHPRRCGRARRRTASLSNSHAGGVR